MATAKKPDSGQNFESALERLEEIVEQMESGKMMLEELIVRYERRNEAGEGVPRNAWPTPSKELKSSPGITQANRSWGFRTDDREEKSAVKAAEKQETTRMTKSELF